MVESVRGEVPVRRGDGVDGHDERVLDAARTLGFAVDNAPDDFLIMLASAVHLAQYDGEEAHVRQHLSCIHDRLQAVRAMRS